MTYFFLFFVSEDIFYSKKMFQFSTSRRFSSSLLFGKSKVKIEKVKKKVTVRVTKLGITQKLTYLHLSALQSFTTTHSLSEAVIFNFNLIQLSQHISFIDIFSDLSTKNHFYVLVHFVFLFRLLLCNVVSSYLHLYLLLLNIFNLRLNNLA